MWDGPFRTGNKDIFLLLFPMKTLNNNNSYLFKLKRPYWNIFYSIIGPLYEKMHQTDLFIVTELFSDFLVFGLLFEKKEKVTGNFKICKTNYQFFLLLFLFFCLWNCWCMNEEKFIKVKSRKFFKVMVNFM